jgi:hypothetical protein
MSKENENVDLFNMSADDPSLNVFDKKQNNLDGIYRPRYKDAKDKKTGYHAKIRFLPNIVLETGKIGAPAIERHMHYADFKDEPNILGWYDCAKNLEEKCDLCTNYWRLKNSKNQVDVEKADLISRQTKYYSYVLVLEDENKPDLVGKILVFSYGYTIKQKIKSDKDGEITGEPCNIFDLAKGKDFKLIIKQKGEFDDYSGSQFLDVSPIKIWNEEKKKFVVPQLDADGRITNPKAQEAIKNFLMARPEAVCIEKYAPKAWDEATRGKIDDIIAKLNGNEITHAERSAKNGGSATAKKTTSKVDELDDDLTSSVTVSEKDFFDEDEDLNLQ